ncbi:hypothetical protein ABT160_38155 [Streptomyces sp. NPDC001941]|uniref:hypothetical protein n=1 Tax=Streptomyces sp. NPDC001941 TaxID=3154659 RepID=UPI003331A369
MKTTRSGYVLAFEHVLDDLRATASLCKNPAHLAFVTTAITAFEQDGPDADPALHGCPRADARRIFTEVTEAYITLDTAMRVQASNGNLFRDFHLPYTRHRGTQARRAAHQARQARRGSTGLDQLRRRLTITPP